MSIYNVIYAQNFQNRSRIRSKTLYMLNFSTKIFEIFEKRYICPTLYISISFFDESIYWICDLNYQNFQKFRNFKIFELFFSEKYFRDGFFCHLQIDSPGLVSDPRYHVCYLTSRNYLYTLSAMCHVPAKMPDPVIQAI